MKVLLYISLLLSFSSFGQNFLGEPPIFLAPVEVIPPASAVGMLFEELPSDPDQYLSLKIHSSLKPAIRVPHSQLLPNSKRNQITPIADINYLNSSTSSQGQYKIGLGAQYQAFFGSKWYLRLAATQGLSQTDSTYAPKSYFYWKTKSAFNYTDIRSRVSFTPNHIFNFQIGLDHNFIGEGSRSMLLDDYGKPYPFGLIRANFWRLEYSILYQFMREGQRKDWEGKFVSSHHISLNATKWLNFGIFETVIFQPKDTLLNRGFDAEYLNPMVFYRPQEYSLGSSDNILIGFEMTAKYKQHTAYFQFILDEFFLAEIKAHNGWWANKFGGQLGVKGRFKKGENKFFYRVESNFSRPFTYSHISDDLNYGNQGTPLAHVYGSNFVEVLGELKWQRNNFGAKLFTNYSMHGSDKNGYNYGADIYVPYINKPSEHGHFIGNGTQRNFFRAQLTFNYLVRRPGNLRVFAENLVVYDVQNAKTNYTLVLGLRSMLWNDRRNY